VPLKEYIKELKEKEKELVKSNTASA